MLTSLCALQRGSRSATASNREQLEEALTQVGMRNLYPHQVDGVRWMLQKEHAGCPANEVPENTGGIIADDMGTKWIYICIFVIRLSSSFIQVLAKRGNLYR